MRRTIAILLVGLVLGFCVGGTAFWGVTHYQTQIAHASTEKEKTDEALAEYTLWLMAFTGILAVATIGLGTATVGLYLTGEKQVAITREALIGDQRAWLVTKMEIGPDGLTVKDGIVHLDVLLKVSNFGRTPALGAHTNMKLIVGVEESAEQVKRLADEHKADSPHGLFLSPNDSYYRPWYPSSMDRDDPSQRRLIISPLLIGCVTYRVLQDKDLHQVAFVYHLGRKDGSPWGAIIGGNDCHLSPDEVTISPWAGGFAT
jgi:hypothetical protein